MLTASSAAAGYATARQAERKAKLQHLKGLCGSKEPSKEDVLNAVSDYAAFGDSKNGAEFKAEDFSKENVEENFEKYEDDETEKADLAGFMFSLFKVKLQMARVPDHPGDDLEWNDCDPDLERQFLPDTTEFQLVAAPFLLRQKLCIPRKPQSFLSRNAAFKSLDCDLEDQGNVLWRLDVPTSGFPVGDLTEGGVCILREHHRHVMFVALSWLLRNSITAALNVDTGLTPATVAAICGSAGIGKSRSLVFLMWFLLRQRAAFLLECGSRRRFVLVRPRQLTVTIYADFNDVATTVECDRSLISIVDPEQFQEGKKPRLSPLLNSMGHTSLTSPSADPKHLPRGDKNDHILRRFWVSPWPESLLQAVRPFFSIDPMTKEELSNHFAVVGGIPRAIFREGTSITRYNIIDNSNLVEDIDKLYDAMMQDGCYEKMMPKVPQCFLGYHSRFPFTSDARTRRTKKKCVWIEFLSREGHNRYGIHLYKRLRTSLFEHYKHDDHSSTGMFFERWVGAFLSNGKDRFIQPPFVLREFKGGSPVDKDIDMPISASVLRYTDEDLLLRSLMAGTEAVGGMFPRDGLVCEAPRGTPVYDFAISKRWMVNATIAANHPLSKATVKKLIARVQATAEDPLHLVFFVLNEKHAKEYSLRQGGERYTGEDELPDITNEQVQILKEAAVGDYSPRRLERVALGLDLPTQETKKKRKRNGGKLTDEYELGPTPPFRLINSVMKKLLFTCEGKLEAKWGRLVSYVNGLSSDAFDSDEFNPACIVQHVITLVPNPRDAANLRLMKR